MAINRRQTLGKFMDVVCFQYLRVNTEDVAGRAPIIAAGRKRGYDIVVALGLEGQVDDAAVMREKLNNILGVDGTRLCIVEQVTALPNGGYEVRIIESACTAEQESGEPLCAFTLGVFVGAIHALTGVRMAGQELECQACGAAQCVYQITPI